MSQFPQVNVIDPVSPATAQGIGTVSQNLNAAEDRKLAAARMRQEGSIAAKQMDLEATRLEAEQEMEDLQREQQQRMAEMQSEDTRYSADKEAATWENKNALDAQIAREGMAQDERLFQMRQEEEKRRDREANELTLERDLISARQSRAVAEAEADFKVREAVVNRRLAENTAMGIIMQKDKMRMEGQKPGLVSKMESQLQSFIAPLTKGEELGRQSVELGFAEMGNAMSDIMDLNQYDKTGRGSVMRGVASVVAEAESMLGGSAPLVIYKKPSTGLIRENFPLGGNDAGEGYEEATPEAVSAHLAKGFARGAAMTLTDGLGIENQAAVEGSLTNILQSALAAHTRANADTSSTDQQAVAESKSLYANVLEKEIQNLEGMGVPKQAVMEMVEGIALKTSAEISKLNQAGNITAEGVLPTAQQKMRIETLKKGVDKIRRSALLAKSGLNGKVMRSVDVQQLQGILLNHWVRNAPPEEIELELMNRFELQGPEYARQFVTSLMDHLDEDQLKALLAGEKNIDDRARKLEKDRMNIEMAGSTYMAEQAGSAAAMAPFHQTESDINSLLERIRE